MYKKCVKICKLNNFHEHSCRNDPSQRLCKMSCNNSVTLIMNKILISTEGPSFILWHKSIYGETNKTSQKYQTPKPVKSIKSSKPIISSQYLSNPMQLIVLKNRGRIGQACRIKRGELEKSICVVKGAQLQLYCLDILDNRAQDIYQNQALFPYSRLVQKVRFQMI